MEGTDSYKSLLDKIQSIINPELKRKGFKKKGRTFNRWINGGIVEVINFQMDKYPIGPQYEIPGLRENLWGKFTVNLGVTSNSLLQLFGKEANSFVQEYECEIRIRLGELETNSDIWYNLDENYTSTAEGLISDLSGNAEKWFQRFNSVDKMVSELLHGNLTLRGKLCASLIQMDISRETGEKTFKEYYESIENEKPHKRWVKDLANKMNIEIE